MSLIKWIRQRTERSLSAFLRGEPDQDLRRGLQQATQVQAALVQIEVQLSHRYEPDQLAITRARLERVRDYIRLAKLECEAREAGLTAQVRVCRSPGLHWAVISKIHRLAAKLLIKPQTAADTRLLPYPHTSK
jgi:hypothetical protein